jgi:hypothetical protein
MDAVNLQQKINPNNINSFELVKQQYKSHGSFGLYRGFTTAYYSSALTGFAFFSIYKGLKTKMKEVV